MFLRTISTATILAPLIDCHGPDRTVSGLLNVHSGSFNNAEQFSIDVPFKALYTVKQKVDKMNSLLTCLRRVISAE